MDNLPLGLKIHPGLVSVTFRPLTPSEIIALVCQAGLRGIEWGGDMHVPHGDLAQARQVGQMTRDAGLQVVAYGSYYRVWPPEPLPFEMVLETALALGAPLIRVWAGKLGSQEANPAHWDALAMQTKRIAGLAAAAGLHLAFEYHAGTLTDTDASARQLLARVGQANLGSYWQPRVAATVDENLASLEGISPWLRHLHVFHWQMTTAGASKRHPLSEGQTAWQHYLACAACVAGERYALIEFVRDDSPTAFMEDAAVLKQLLAGGMPA